MTKQNLIIKVLESWNNTHHKGINEALKCEAIVRRFKHLITQSVNILSDFWVLSLSYINLIHIAYMLNFISQQTFAITCFRRRMWRVTMAVSDILIGSSIQLLNLTCFICRQHSVLICALLIPSRTRESFIWSWAHKIDKMMTSVKKRQSEAIQRF